MKHKSIVENVAKIIFTVCAVVAIFAVLSITIYMFLKGAPAFFKVGVLNLLFGTKWAPTAADPSYGILYIILTSIIGTAVSILIGVPIALLTAVFLTEVSNLIRYYTSWRNIFLQTQQHISLPADQICLQQS